MSEKKYTIIYADPPWKYVQDKKGKKFGGVTSSYYQTLNTEQICRYDIKNIVNNPCILFIWATFPNIKEALKVIECWGFHYKTVGFVWIKKNIISDSLFWGTGFYTRSNCEICLIGVTKNAKLKDLIKSHAVHQIIHTKIEKHSKKPDEVRDKIIKLCGDVSRIELFARKKIKGWDVWGDEVKSDIKISLKNDNPPLQSRIRD
ncbi:MAG: MT-A70 family methyltransferase [Nanoarchaeota archaeon]